jgi:Pyruvate/2-oxoacid:ferredoxin oxidoreductase delta subunit
MIVGDNFTKVKSVTPKSQKFICKICDQVFYCVNLERVNGKLVNLCNYNYCPFCGEFLYVIKRSLKDVES